MDTSERDRIAGLRHCLAELGWETYFKVFFAPLFIGLALLVAYCLPHGTWELLLGICLVATWIAMTVILGIWTPGAPPAESG